MKGRVLVGGWAMNVSKLSFSLCSLCAGIQRKSDLMIRKSVSSSAYYDNLRAVNAT